MSWAPGAFGPSIVLHARISAGRYIVCDGVNRAPIAASVRLYDEVPRFAVSGRPHDHPTLAKHPRGLDPLRNQKSEDLCSDWRFCIGYE
jgi:hypothetical protein